MSRFIDLLSTYGLFWAFPPVSGHRLWVYRPAPAAATGKTRACPSRKGGERPAAASASP